VTEIEWGPSTYGLFRCCKSPGDNIDTVKKSTDTLIDASEEVELDINVKKTKYILLSCHQTAGKIRDIKL
jgi:hypothetical protein